MYIAHGSYAGDGADDRAITGLAFQPQFVLVKGGANIAVVRTSTYAGDRSHTLTGLTYAANRIQAMTGTGFTVGTDAQVNAVGTTYYWLALAEEPGVADCKVVTYTGNGGASQAITGVGFQPNLVLILPASANFAVAWKTSPMAATSAQFLDAALVTTLITAIGSDGFTVTGDMNSNGVGYHALCVKAGADLFLVKAYTGDGTDNRSISLARLAIDGVEWPGFVPQAVLVKADSTAAGALRLRDQTGDSSFLVDATAAAADRIQAMATSDGSGSVGFEVGTTAAVNADTVLCYAVAFGIGAHRLRGRAVLGAMRSVYPMPAMSGRYVLPAMRGVATLR